MVCQIQSMDFTSWYNPSQAYTAKRVIPTPDRNNMAFYNGMCHMYWRYEIIIIIRPHILATQDQVLRMAGSGRGRGVAYPVASSELISFDTDHVALIPPCLPQLLTWTTGQTGQRGWLSGFRLVDWGPGLESCSSQWLSNHPACMIWPGTLVALYKCETACGTCRL